MIRFQHENVVYPNGESAGELGSGNRVSVVSQGRLLPGAVGGLLVGEAFRLLTAERLSQPAVLDRTELSSFLFTAFWHFVLVRV